MPTVSSGVEYIYTSVRSDVQVESGTARYRSVVGFRYRMVGWEDCKDVHERLKWVRENILDDISFDATERYLKEIIGDQRADEVPVGQSIRRYEKDGTPDANYIDIFSRATEINPTWIVSGRGRPDDPVGTHERLRAMEIVARGKEEEVAAMLAAIESAEDEEGKKDRELAATSEGERPQDPEDGDEGDRGKVDGGGA